MDIYCRHCREPWDNDSLHEEVAERRALIKAEMRPGAARERRLAAQNYHRVYAEFRTYGCGAFAAFSTGVVIFKADDTAQLTRCPRGTGRNEDIATIQDLLGDDVDGATAMLEDFGLV